MNTIPAFIGHEDDHPDTWICICGNTESTAGFEPCDENGTDMEPVAGWPNLYRCNTCNIIIKHPTRQIVGTAAEKPAHTGVDDIPHP